MPAGTVAAAVLFSSDVSAKGREPNEQDAAKDTALLQVTHQRAIADRVRLVHKHNLLKAL